MSLLELPTREGYRITVEPQHIESVHLNIYSNSERIDLHIYINHKAHSVLVLDDEDSISKYRMIQDFMRGRTIA